MKKQHQQDPKTGVTSSKVQEHPVTRDEHKKNKEAKAATLPQVEIDPDELPDAENPAYDVSTVTPYIKQVVERMKQAQKEKEVTEPQTQALAVVKPAGLSLYTNTALAIRPSQDKRTFLRAASRVSIEGLSRAIVHEHLELKNITTTINEAVEAGATISDAEEDIMIDLCVLIEDFQLFLNVTPDNRLTKQGMRDVASFMVDKMGGLSLFELAHVLSDAKIGKYGKVYNRIDGNVLCGYVTAYQEQKQKIVIRERQEYHERLKAKGLA